MAFTDRNRAESFGSDAEQYDRARPTYPPELVEDLLHEVAGVAGDAVEVLDVGCGTGKAGLLFAGRGARVLGVEPDARMASVARRHGLEVEIAKFEDWDPAGRRFDLAVAGQAWHWVEPIVGFAKAGAVLRPGGRLALFWNTYHHLPEVKDVLLAAYTAHAPELVDGNIAINPARLEPEEESEDAEMLAAAGCFGAPERRAYSWVRAYTATSWLEELATHSIHGRLMPEERDVLFATIRRGLEPLGDFEVPYETAALVVERR